MHAMYRIKVMLRNWQTLFWSLAFPIFLSTVFYFMFGGIRELTMFQEMSLGVMISGAESREFVKIAGDVEISDGKKMFNIVEFTSLEEANNKLKNNEIVAYVDPAANFEVTVKESSTANSLVKTFVDQYLQNKKLVMDMAEKNPELLPQLLGAMNDGVGKEIRLHNIDLKGRDKDSFSQYFYAVIAMTCLIACNMGLDVTANIQANQTMVGARRNVSSTGKGKQLVEDFLATFVLYDVLTLLVLGFMIFLLKRDFGSDLGLIVLATFVGNFTGLAVGLFFGVMQKKAGKLNGACVAFFMGSSFFAGLQWADITFILEQNAPIINRINPATLIVNSFKSLAVFGDYGKYFTNVITLFAIGLFFIIISVIKFRRTKYASI